MHKKYLYFNHLHYKMANNQIEIMNKFIIFLIAIISTYLAVKLAPFLSLIDHPDEKLKSHIKPTPSTGGLAIISSITIGLILNYNFEIVNEYIVVILFLLGIFSLGVLDDKYNLSVSSRLLIQFNLVILLLFFIPPLNISGIFFLDFIISIIFCIACINAMNILDIMDGLAGGVAFFSLLNCLIFLENNIFFYNSLILYTLISLLAFLIFNFNPAKIFMGDAGSTFLGGLIAVIILVIFQKATTIQEKISYLFPVSVIFYELLFVIIIRLKKGLNPTQGSPDHLPLRIRKLGFSIKETVLIMYLFSALCVAFSILLKYSTLPIIPIIIFVIFLLIISIKMSKVIVD